MRVMVQVMCFIVSRLKQCEKKRKTSRARPHHHRHIIYPCFISNSALVSDKSPSSLNPRQRRPLAHPSREHSIEVSPGFFFDGVVPIVVGSLISSVFRRRRRRRRRHTHARALSVSVSPKRDNFSERIEPDLPKPRRDAIGRTPRTEASVEELFRVGFGFPTYILSFVKRCRR
jgi:hypothetical protein